MLPGHPLAENFSTHGEHFTLSNSFLIPIVSEILGGPKFTLGVPEPPGRLLAETNLYPKRVLCHI